MESAQANTDKTPLYVHREFDPDNGFYYVYIPSKASESLGTDKGRNLALMKWIDAQPEGVYTDVVDLCTYPTYIGATRCNPEDYPPKLTLVIHVTRPTGGEYHASIYGNSEIWESDNVSASNAIQKLIARLAGCPEYANVQVHESYHDYPARL